VDDTKGFFADQGKELKWPNMEFKARYKSGDVYFRTMRLQEVIYEVISATDAVVNLDFKDLDSSTENGTNGLNISRSNFRKINDNVLRVVISKYDELIEEIITILRESLSVFENNYNTYIITLMPNFVLNYSVLLYFLYTIVSKENDNIRLFILIDPQFTAKNMEEIVTYGMELELYLGSCEGENFAALSTGQKKNLLQLQSRVKLSHLSKSRSRR
jgi:hypothetical protein